MGDFALETVPPILSQLPDQMGNKISDSFKDSHGDGQDAKEDPAQANIHDVETPIVLSVENQLADKKLVRKIDMHIMPLLFCCYGLQYMDKRGVTSGVAFGLTTDTHLVGQEYAWLSTGFYLAYLAAEFPMNYLMQRFRIDRVLAICCALWGICVFGVAASNNFTQLMVCRALLGITEAAALPGYMIVTTAWYRTSEQQIRVQLWVLSNPIFSFWVLMVFYVLGKDSKPIAGWRAIHLFLGSLSIVWAVIVWWYLATPLNARWLTPEEKVRAHDRLIVNQAGESESGSKVNWAEVREAFTDPMVWWSLVFSLLNCLSTGGSSAFASYILQSFNLSKPNSIAYQIPQEATFLVGLVIAGYLCHRYQHKNINLICCMVSCVPALIGVFLQALLDNNHRWARITGYWMMGFFTVSIYIVWAQNGVNVAGRTKKSTVQAMVFSTFAIGYMIGPQAFRDQDAPKYLPGLYFCAACYSLMFLTAILWRIYIIRENKRRDRLVESIGMSKEAAEAEGRANGVKGMTDRQNIHFRYRC